MKKAKRIEKLGRLFSEIKSDNGLCGDSDTTALAEHAYQNGCIPVTPSGV